MRRLTLEHYVHRSYRLNLVASLCDGVEMYDYLNGGGEVDLIIMNLGTVALEAEDIRPATQVPAPRWLLIEQMGNVPAFSCAPGTGQLTQPLCLNRFEQLVGQALEQLAA